MTTRPLMCPVCKKGRLLDINIEIEAKTIEKERIPNGDKVDFYAKCWKCSHEIGIKKVS